MCRDCYDYQSHIVWQWWAPELWRRFTIDLRRALARHLGVPDSRLARARDGAVREGGRVPAARHRPLPRPHPPRRPRTDDGFAPAPGGMTAALLLGVVGQAAAGVAFDAPPLYEGDVVRRLRFGAQVDSRPIRDRPADR